MGTLWSIKICSNFSYLYQLQNILNWYITWGQNLYRVEFKHSLILSFYMSKVKSVQEASAKFFAVQMLKSKIFPIEWKKNETMNIILLVFSLLSIYLAFWCFLFYFFMWFARFQILISEPQRICTELTLSGLMSNFIKKSVTLSKIGNNLNHFA